MDSFTNEELKRAADRVRDMQRRAAAVGGGKNNMIEKSESKPKTVAPPRRKSILELINFKNMEIDNDRSLLMGILLLLSGDTTDELLMLALIYIML